MLQIMDTRMEFPCPFWGVVIDPFSTTTLFIINNPTFISLKLFKAQCDDATAYGNIISIATQ